MNATALNIRLVHGVETELDLTGIPSQSESELDRMGDVMRRARAKYEQRVASTKKRLKGEIAGFKADRAALKAEYETSLSMLTEREVRAREQAKVDIEADERLISSAKAALTALAV